VRARSDFSVQAWAPESISDVHGSSATVAMTMTLVSEISRANVRGFAQSVQNAIVVALNEDRQDNQGKTCYDSQVSVDTVYSNGVQIWSRPESLKYGNRRLLQQNRNAQRLRVDITFAAVDYKNAMTLPMMMRIFEKQLSRPASPLIHQPIFFGSVIHNVHTIETSDYKPPSSVRRTTELAPSSSFRAVPVLFLLLALLL
jgi:hypothetical protein